MQKEVLRLKVSGFVSEVFCGEIPVRCKQAFTRYLLGDRNAAEIPSWVIRRCPHYVRPEEIKQLWYHQNAEGGRGKAEVGRGKGEGGRGKGEGGRRKVKG